MSDTLKSYFYQRGYDAVKRYDYESDGFLIVQY